MVMALFYPNPKHQLSSRERSHARFAFPSFQRGFLFELTSSGRVRAPTTTGLEFFRDRFVNVFMLDNHSREEFPYRGLMTVYGNTLKAAFENITLLYPACFVFSIIIAIA